jgi:hypothetical protein
MATAFKSSTPTPGNTVGVASEASGYKLNDLTYPEDLFGTLDYGGNYVVFFINVSEDSTLLSSGASTAYKGDVPPRLRGQGIAAAADKNVVTGIATVLGATAGTALGSGPLGAVIAGGGTAAVPTPAGGKLTRPQKRLDTAIALYMPNQLNIRYGVQYEEETMMVLAAAGKVSEIVNNAIGDGNFDAKSAGSAARNFIANQAISKDVPGAAAAAFGAGVAANPKKEQVFKGVDFRSFQFNYQFFPRSETEARKVLDIIQTFKLHMHPELKGDDGFLYIYPSEFDIMYFNGGSQNGAVHKHTSCVLKEMNVNYSPQGQFNAFKNGMPVQINIDMTFLELGLLTKKEIQEGL